MENVVWKGYRLSICPQFFHLFLDLERPPSKNLWKNSSNPSFTTFFQSNLTTYFFSPLTLPYSQAVAPAPSEWIPPTELRTASDAAVPDLSKRVWTLETSQHLGKETRLSLQVVRALLCLKQWAEALRSLTDSCDTGLQDGSLKRRIGLEHANVISKSLDVFLLKGLSVHIQGSPEAAERKAKERTIMYPTGETNTYIMIGLLVKYSNVCAENCQSNQGYYWDTPLRHQWARHQPTDCKDPDSTLWPP